MKTVSDAANWILDFLRGVPESKLLLALVENKLLLGLVVSVFVGGLVMLLRHAGWSSRSEQKAAVVVRAPGGAMLTRAVLEVLPEHVLGRLRAMVGWKPPLHWREHA